MTSFWPSDLNLEDTSDPLEIIEAARREWHDKSNGRLTLVVQETVSSNENDMLIVHAKHIPSNRTVTLFSVIHRPNNPYPVRIQPKGDELPDQFKKSYYKPGFAEFSGIEEMSGRSVTNEWVCDTPEEFRSKLEKVFNLGTLKSDVLNLVSSSAPRDSSSERKVHNQGDEQQSEEGDPAT